MPSDSQLRSLSDRVSVVKTTASILLLVALGCAPIGETPGIRLGGSGAPAPDSFAFVRDSEVIQLEAQGRLLPRVVNIWGVGFDEAMYVWSDLGTGWSRRVEERPNDVRVRVGSRVYEVRASKVSDAGERKRVGEAFQMKYAEPILELYGRPMTVDNFEVLYRLTPRN